MRVWYFMPFFSHFLLEYSASLSCIMALSINKMAERLRVACVQKIFPHKPSLLNFGSLPMLSICAWLKTTQSTLAGGYSHVSLNFFISSSCPWYKPTSMAKVKPLSNSTTCQLPVTSLLEKQKCIFILNHFKSKKID